jgi:hypothetical protein
MEIEITNYSYRSGNEEPIYFESQEELDAYLDTLPKVWSKEAHIAEINALHSQEFKRRYLALDYEDGWDVHLYAKSSELGFQEEAQELLKYWTDGFAAIIAYGETVTEETAQDPIVFVSSI